MRNFRLFDLAFFSILAILSEALAQYLAVSKGLGFCISFTLALTVIAMIRWGAVGCVAGVAGGLGAYLMGGSGDYRALLYYAGANLFLVLPVLAFGSRDTDWLPEQSGRLIGLVISCFLCLCAGKWLVLAVFYQDWDGGVDYFLAEMIPLVLNVLLCLLLRSREGLICNMRMEEENGQA